MNTEYFEIDERFRGPPNSGNGGYVCGRIAQHLHGTATVRLKAPPPLNSLLRLESTENEARLFCESTLVGEAKRAELDLSAGPCPSFATAQSSMANFVGFNSHQFPGCFVCGPIRAAGDGMRIFPGSSPDTANLASPWIPDETLADETGTVRKEFLWAALDCPGGFAVFPLPEGTATVLGELCASILGTVKVGERCVVTAWPLQRVGRKREAGSAVYNQQVNSWPRVAPSGSRFRPVCGTRHEVRRGPV